MTWRAVIPSSSQVSFCSSLSIPGCLTLAASSNILGCQHGGVGRALVTVGLDLHATSNTGDGLTAAGNHPELALCPLSCLVFIASVPTCAACPGVLCSLPLLFQFFLSLFLSVWCLARRIHRASSNAHRESRNCVATREAPRSPSEQAHQEQMQFRESTYERSVTWTKVSLKEAKMRATPKTSSPSRV